MPRASHITCKCGRTRPIPAWGDPGSGASNASGIVPGRGTENALPPYSRRDDKGAAAEDRRGARVLNHEG